MRAADRRRRRSVRFRPAVDPAGEGAAILDRRLLLSADATKAARAPLHKAHAGPLAHHVTRASSSSSASGRITPAQEINKQYDLFLKNFQNQEALYVQTFSKQASSSRTVRTFLTAAYQPGSLEMQVQDAAVFGLGVTPSGLSATALVNGSPTGVVSIIGILSTTTLLINPGASSTPPLPVGTVLTATVPSTATSSAGTIFPSYITASSQQLAVNLVSYFNNLPFKLPRKFAFPHQPQQSGALQQYVAQVVVGASFASLEQTLLVIALPLTPGSDLQIYDNTVTTAVNASRVRMLNGVQQIFANKLPVIPTNVLSSSSTSGTGTTTGTTATA
jgi:hypothetical protein